MKRIPQTKEQKKQVEIKQAVDSVSYVMKKEVFNEMTKEFEEAEVFHREDGPAFEFKFASGDKKYESYFIEGKRDRKDGPSTIEYWEDGTVKDEQWYVDDNLHCVDQAAWKEYDEKGTLRVERWFTNGLLDRSEGPAYLVYDESGKVVESIDYKMGEPGNHFKGK